MKSGWKNTLIYFVVVLIGLSLVAPFFTGGGQQKELSFSEFLDRVEKSEVQSVTIAGDTAHGKLKNGQIFHTRVGEMPGLLSTLREKQVAINIEPAGEGSWFWNIILQLLLPLLFFGGLWYLLLRQAQNTNTQALSFGKSRAKPIRGNVKVTFADVAGVDEAKEELQEVVEFLKNPQKFINLGAKIPKGVLVVGPPGTGKTLLAKAIAGEAGVPFFSISGSDFVELFVGVGASRVRDVFVQAKKHSPCIVFIDEIDAVGRHRGAGLGGGHDEREQTLNQLLVEMDGFDVKTNIVIIAATNRPDILDPALLRPGRFDRQIVLDKPDLKGRLEILKIHGKGKPLLSDVNLEVIARGTPGFTGADLANLMNEAAILAARRGLKEITISELQDAEERVIAGPEKRSRVISDHEKEIIAHHEVGHALVARLLPNSDPVHKISILPRGMALGYTMQLPIEDRYLVERNQLLDKITVMLGGRVSEELIFGEITSGAHNDLEHATEVTRRMVCEFGMSQLGPRTFGKVHRHVFLGRDLGETRDYGEDTATAIDKEIRNIIEECHVRARNLLSTNIEKLKQIAVVLMEKETLDGEELESAFASVGLPSAKPVEKKVPPSTAPALQPTPAPQSAPEKKKGGAAGGSPAPQPAY